MTNKQKQLISEYLKNEIRYLDGYGYNTKIEEEIMFNNENSSIQELYNDMFNEFIQPIMNRLKQYNTTIEEQTIFNFFLTDDENNVYGVMYDTGIEFLITENDYNKVIDKVFNEILSFQ